MTLAWILACSGSDDGGKETGDDSGLDTVGETQETEETEPPPWEPAAGDYLVTPGKLLKDTCKLPDDGGGTKPTSGTVTIEVPKDQLTIVMTIPDAKGGPPLVLTCPRKGYGFHCDVADVQDSESLGQFGLDATLLLSIDQDGLWADELHVDGTYSWTSDCLGDDCDFVEEYVGGGFRFPCGGQQEFTADHQG